MSEEKIARINSEPAAKPNSPSIMSAAAPKKSIPVVLALSVGLAGFAVLSVFLLISLISKNDKISQLETSLKSEQAYVEELKSKLSEALDL